MRLDRAVVERNLAPSRTRAQQLIAAGAVSVDGAVVTRASHDVTEAASLAVDSAHYDHYVSRAAHKLIGALDACAPLGLSVVGARALDAGASTGGFTQVLLERGVAHVLAVDVGHGQLHPTIRDDPRVDAVEGVNVRDLTAESDGAGVSLIVADLSFISLTLVVPALVTFAGPRADVVLMVKPQFEIGRERLSRTGVVTADVERRRAVATVVATMLDSGLAIHHIARSVLPGPQGNVEFFVWGSQSWQARTMLSSRATPPVLDDHQISYAIDREVKGSP